ncbi:hypothetical protein GN958_ATG01550 [Phytophthora infestans]|uniref:Uncharacterized protein n=1 Tax=Phytophthora infestans TaxID=4787 RepID=A0A8S9VDI3_PHYIN|nr:hypothetical protein GN958_ATG01550 [Phytophthora infestans]
MTGFADEMQRLLVLRSSAGRNRISEMWLKYDVDPATVFKILLLDDARLGVDDALILHWLRYCKTYRTKVGGSLSTDLETLLAAHPLKMKEQLAATFQLMNGCPGFTETSPENAELPVPEVGEQGLIAGVNFETVGDPGVPNVLKLPKTDHRYKTMEAYTLW